MLQAVAVLQTPAAGWVGFRNFPFIGVFLLTMRSDYSWRGQSISCSHRCRCVVIVSSLRLANFEHLICLHRKLNDFRLKKMKAEAVRSENERNWPMAFRPGGGFIDWATGFWWPSQVFVTGSWRRSLGVDRMPITRMDAVDFRHDDWRMAGPLLQP